jgi:hypothetical protein
MIHELEQRLESGFLGHIASFGVIVQYWRSFAHLEAYARDRDQHHWPAWVDFNKRVGGSRAGIWAFGTRCTSCAPASTSAYTAACHRSAWPKRVRQWTQQVSANRHGGGSRPRNTKVSQLTGAAPEIGEDCYEPIPGLWRNGRPPPGHQHPRFKSSGPFRPKSMRQDYRSSCNTDCEAWFAWASADSPLSVRMLNFVKAAASSAMLASRIRDSDACTETDIDLA